MLISPKKALLAAAGLAAIGGGGVAALEQYDKEKAKGEMRAGGGGIVFNDQGEVLAVIPQKAKKKGFTWEIPGGKVDPGESYRQGAEREFFEETGAKLKSARRPIIKRREPDAMEEGTYHGRFYTGELEGEPHISKPDEIADIGWVAPEQLLEGRWGQKQYDDVLEMAGKLGINVAKESGRRPRVRYRPPTRKMSPEEVKAETEALKGFFTNLGEAHSPEEWDRMIKLRNSLVLPHQARPRGFGVSLSSPMTSWDKWSSGLYERLVKKTAR